MEARFSAPVQTGPGVHPASCTMGTGSFLGAKSGRGVRLTIHPISCRDQERVELYLYSPYGSQDLYRASVPVQGYTLPLPIPLLRLWPTGPIQSLSACTRVHFTFTYTSNPAMGRTVCTEPQCLYKGALYLYLYLYSRYGPYGLYRASVPIQGCTLTLPIPLLPLWAVRPVQSLSVCTRVHFTFTFYESVALLINPTTSD